MTAPQIGHYQQNKGKIPPKSRLVNQSLYWDYLLEYEGCYVLECGERLLTGAWETEKPILTWTKTQFEARCRQHH